ncbi:MAG TPA: phenylalanine--tRNA ligase subunit beta [Streptosporangiaceae bacterium]|jgi:phenylalanyl-tRNA synthetase beta chain
MRVPLSWLLEYVSAGPDGEDPASSGPAEVARRLTAAGLEVETVEQAGHDISGVVIAQVSDVEELTGFGKPIRYCRVSAGAAEHHVICGAVNFAAGDKVALARPGAVLPGGFEIGARKTYGKISEGMICSAAELAIGDDHSGILVLPPDAPAGADFVSYAGLADHVLDVNVTPDKGYALSIRGIARELAIAYGAPFTDPADAGLPAGFGPVAAQAYPAAIEDPAGCDRFVLRDVLGIDGTRPTPLPMRIRLARCGMRTVSLAVDITNYLMLELGQPLHAFDRDRLSGPVVVRRARPGERLETLDHVLRELDPDDILITDSSGPISLAGTMGGLATEVSAGSRDLVIEAAHFSATGVARMSRRHKLASEASSRFERGVDRELPLRASAKAATLLAALGGGSVAPGCTHAWAPAEPVTIEIAADYPDQVAGMSYGRGTVTGRLRQVGCQVEAAGAGLAVTPPSWRPDLTDPADLAEEVIRLEGYENIPVHSARATAGRGRTAAQRLRTSIGRSLAAAGYVEVLSSPFGGAEDAGRLQLPAGDQRRHATRISNPLREDEPLLRTTLLPGMLRVLARNLGRGFADLALYELGLVFLARPDGPASAPILAVDRAPTAQELATLQAALPDQPLHAGVVLAGRRDPAGWWGQGRPACWADAVEAARQVAMVSRVPCEIRAARQQPWHPGRCAALYLAPAGGVPVLAGYAGELHPRVIQAFGVPDRTCAAELDLSVLEAAAAALDPALAPVISGYPPATQDVALIVPDSVPAAQVEQALTDGVAAAGGGLSLEDVRLFDVYTGEQAGPGRKSLAYTLRFRAPDRTLTADEASAARDAAVAEAARRTGAVQRTGG